MSLKQGTIRNEDAVKLLEMHGPEYLRYLLQSSWAKLQVHERLSSGEEAAILTVLGQHEKREEMDRRKAQAEEFDRQHDRHKEILAEARKANETTERTVEVANLSVAVAEKSVKIAENALGESKRSADAAEQQAKLASTAVGVSEEATKAAKASAQIAKKQYWLSIVSASVAVSALAVSVVALYMSKT